MEDEHADIGQHDACEDSDEGRHALAARRSHRRDAARVRHGRHAVNEGPPAKEERLKRRAAMRKKHERAGNEPLIPKP